jgi:hypothetical protein
MQRWLGLALCMIVGCGGGEEPQCSVVGAWKAGFDRVTFYADGSWQIGSSGPGGGWQQSGNTLTIADTTNSCGGVPGTYSLQFDSGCQETTLRKVKDTCDDRARALDGLSATRTSSSTPRPDLAEAVVLPDLATRKPDLTQVLNGCNGLLMCYIECSNSGGAQACYDDCDAGATQRAQDLLNAYGACIDTNCFQAIDNDSGMPYCSDATIDSKPCDECYARILGSGGACRTAQLDCVASKP